MGIAMQQVSFNALGDESTCNAKGKAKGKRPDQRNTGFACPFALFSHRNYCVFKQWKALAALSRFSMDSRFCSLQDSSFRDVVFRYFLPSHFAQVVRWPAVEPSAPTSIVYTSECLPSRAPD